MENIRNYFDNFRGNVDISYNRNGTEYGYIMLKRSDGYYGMILRFTYGSVPTFEMASKASGIWYPENSWIRFVRTSDLGYVDCEVTTVANNAVIISGAPSKDGYIPVIIEHNQTRHVMESIFRTSGDWCIYSNQSQEVKVRFYKYPA